MLNRNYDNVNKTRHSVNGEMQKLCIDFDMLHNEIKDMKKHVTDGSGVLTSLKEAGQQVKGGARLAQFIYPVLAALVGVAAGHWVQ